MNELSSIQKCEFFVFVYIYIYMQYILYIYKYMYIYIYFLDLFHIFSCVFLNLFRRQQLWAFKNWFYCLLKSGRNSHSKTHHFCVLVSFFVDVLRARVWIGPIWSQGPPNRIKKNTQTSETKQVTFSGGSCRPGQLLDNTGQVSLFRF